ncbi:AraC family transcriptional regulator (plasmid) [Nocardia sp. NBC_01377]|uniref:helix-turn-helix domain-containing protein n=1 Tax=Nocardia sp. NBC_01377 TaxID=2903595 RepID=UPI003244CEFC
MEFGFPNGTHAFSGKTQVQRAVEGSLVRQIVEFQSDAVCYERFPHQTGDDTDKRVVIPVTGEVILKQREREAVLLPGHLGIITMALPMGLAHGDGVRAWILTIPEKAIPTLTDRTPIALNPEDGAIAAAVAMTQALVNTRATSSAESFNRVFAALTDLVAGSVDPRREPEIAEFAQVERDARAYVERNYSDHRVTAASVAQHLNWSSRRLAYALEYMGTSPGKMLRGVRLQRAAQLLQSPSRINLNEIAYNCGFGSTTGFRGAWQRHYGISVTEWRELGLAGKGWRPPLSSIDDIEQ